MKTILLLLLASVSAAWVSATDLRDFVLLSQCWEKPRCYECVGADCSGNGIVDATDLLIFAEGWLSVSLPNKIQVMGITNPAVVNGLYFLDEANGWYNKGGNPEDCQIFLNLKLPESLFYWQIQTADGDWVANSELIATETSSPVDLDYTTLEPYTGTATISRLPNKIQVTGITNPAVVNGTYFLDEANGFYNKDANPADCQIFLNLKLPESLFYWQIQTADGDWVANSELVATEISSPVDLDYTTLEPYTGTATISKYRDYNVYRGQDGVIDYNTPIATMLLDDTQVAIAGQTLPAGTIWHYVRRRIKNCCELQSLDSPVCIVRIGDDGEIRGDMPNPPTDLIAEGMAGGKIRLRWRYSAASQETPPAGFAIFVSDSDTPWDFDDPVGLVESGIGRNNSFSWTSAAMTHGKLYRFIVRAYSATGELSQNTNEVSFAADAVGPEAIATVFAEWAVD
jgi:hypothetical protein